MALGSVSRPAGMLSLCCPHLRWSNQPAYHFGSGVSARFHPAKHNGRSDDSQVLALGRFPLARSPSAALRVQAFVPCMPPISLLTLGVGGVPRPCYAGTGKRDSLEEISSVVAFLYAGTRLSCRTYIRCWRRKTCRWTFFHGCLARPPSGTSPEFWRVASDSHLYLSRYRPDVSISWTLPQALASSGILLPRRIRLAPTLGGDQSPRGRLGVTPFPIPIV